MALPTPAAGEAHRRDRGDRGERNDRGGRGERNDRGGRGGRGGRRGERSGERAEGGNDMQGRSNRGERAAADGTRAEPADAGRGEAREAREAREPRDGRGGRGERGPREPRQDGRGDERRGPRNERGPRSGEGSDVAAAEPAAQPPFVDTMPNGQASPGSDAEGERQGGRRRNRRGGRGRDRDEAASPDANGHAAPLESSVQAARHDVGNVSSEANGSVATREAGADAGVESNAHPADSQGEESGQRRRRGGRGRDRAPREAFPEAESSGATAASTELVEPAANAPTLPFADAGVDADRGMSFASPPESSRHAEAAPAAEPLQWPAEPLPPIEPGHPLATPAAVAAPAAQDYVLPVDSLLAVAQGAGLQWVNSDAAKIQAVHEAMAAAPAPIHVPREIRKLERVDEGPLVLVETKKDLSQVRLPFEMQSPGD